MTDSATAELVSDFRYAIDVMEESDHLGLDDEHARLLHGILQRRIDEACAALSGKQTVEPAKKRITSFAFPVDSELTL